MERYTLYCTEEQTKKALKLKAPIEFEQTIVHDWSTGKPVAYPDIETDKNGEPILIKPTSEQMQGWLRKEHNIHIRINCEGSENYVVQLQFINSSKDIDIENHNYKGIIGHRGYPSASEATLAAIDAALEYLVDNNLIK